MNRTAMSEDDGLAPKFERLRLFHTATNYEELLKEAAQKNLPHRALVERLLDNEIAWRYDRYVARLIKEARFPTIKTIDAFDWSHPTSIPKQLILNALRLDFIDKRGHFIFLGRGGLGKTHLALAIGYAACQREIRTLWTTAADMINRLVASKADHTLERALRKYCSPRLLCIDELGCAPRGAETPRGRHGPPMAAAAAVRS